MASYKYEIDKDDWQVAGDDAWDYIDDDLQMCVILQRDTGCSPEADGIDNPYTVLAQSYTYADEGNYYMYDAMSKRYYNGPTATKVPACAVLDIMGDPRSLVLPDWLIDQMQYLIECDEFAASCAYDWAQENTDTVWATSEEREKSAEEWFGRNYPDGDEHAPWGAEDMLYMADMYCMLTHHDGKYRVRY